MEHETDVLVIGYGIAGACAALAARAGGARVTIAERAGGGGGTSAMSSGIFYMGGGTALQRDLGVDDDPEQMFRFMAASCGVSDPTILRVFCEGCPEHFDWLEAQGIRFQRSLYPDKHLCPPTPEGLLSTGNEKVWPFREIARPAMRGHRVDREGDNAGLPAMEALIERCTEAGVDVLPDTRATELLSDEGGRIVGARLRSGGEEFEVRARGGVILATGGYQMNAAMMEKSASFLVKAAEPIGTPYSDGSGIELGTSVGAALEALDAVHATASFYPPPKLIRGIVVNALGQRFVAEDGYHGRTAAHIFEQPGRKAYLLLDSECFGYPELAEFFNYSLIDAWETLAEAESGLGMPAGSLEDTVRQYNEDARDGCDRLLGKYADWLAPLDNPPYAAFDLSVGAAKYHYHTLGGLKVDADARVLGTDGKVIPGLYAAGSCAVSIIASAKGYGSGMTLSSGSFFGRVAGRNASGVAARSPSGKQHAIS